MSALEPEPPAVMWNLEEEQYSSHEPGQVFTQLLAALENPDIKALEWSHDGQDVIVDTELYKEEMGKNKELFPELADLGSVAALQVWLQGYGFKVTGTKVKLQHPYFQRAHRTAEQPGALRGNAETSASQQKKKKKRKTPASCQHPHGGSMSQNTLGQRPRLRPLYQYINFEMPELMHPSGDHVPEVAQPNQVPAGSGIVTAPQLQGEDTWISSTLEISALEASNTFTPIDVDGMMTYEAHQVPAFFPRYK